MASIISPNPLFFFPPKKLKSFKPIFASSTADGLPEEEAGPAPDPVKVALAKAEAFKKSKSAAPVPVTADDDEGGGIPAAKAPDPVKLAMERAREYKKNKGAKLKTTAKVKNSGPEDLNVTNTKEGSLTNKVSKKEVPKLSNIDFVGFEFSEKKRYRGMPPGLATPVMEPFLDGEIPEVEIIVGDASKFEVTAPQSKSSTLDSDNMDVYKPKVSTWGVFPRPSNISKTFGGGRTIRPGEVLETVEDKAAKENRSRELIASYKRKMGLTIDAKTKAECKKALKEGDNLMDLGKLREALPFYEKVMESVVFQSELHGLAALQWSVCQDSLRRSSDAHGMYEKLRSHPNAQVSKKARHFAFSFQAMEMMKVTSSSTSRSTGYENYFDAFVENKANYDPADEELGQSVLEQSLPYILLLVSPIFFVLFAAVRKSFKF